MALNHLHCWLETQLPSGFGQGLIQGGKAGVTLTAQEMQGIVEDQPLLVAGQGLPHQILLLQVHLANRHQTLQRRNHRGRAPMGIDR